MNYRYEFVLFYKGMVWKRVRSIVKEDKCLDLSDIYKLRESKLGVVGICI